MELDDEELKNTHFHLFCLDECGEKVYIDIDEDTKNAIILTTDQEPPLFLFVGRQSGELVRLIKDGGKRWNYLSINMLSELHFVLRDHVSAVFLFSFPCKFEKHLCLSIIDSRTVVQFVNPNDAKRDKSKLLFCEFPTRPLIK